MSQEQQVVSKPNNGCETDNEEYYDEKHADFIYDALYKACDKQQYEVVQFLCELDDGEHTAGLSADKHMLRAIEMDDVKLCKLLQRGRVDYNDDIKFFEAVVQNAQQGKF